MFTLRGDVHRIYLKIRRAVHKKEPIAKLKMMHEIDNIKDFYNTLSEDELRLIRYRFIKEKNGAGTIPILVSTIPWLGLIFSKQIQGFAEKNLHIIILALLIYTSITIASILVHYREQAWASVHHEIIENLLQEYSEERETKST
ncbi:hypothetical protein [Bacillus sp. FJAT-45350]|uniref:hypothetical protein n=1 Tax=Bacillus sp. FJAT-45350 TaxID=2011014 RepID=UPI000BB97FAD|nr:hypothetical protein [Bacillus sp. FJAT-45350]